MNQTTTQPLTALERSTQAQASTTMSFYSMLPPLDTSNLPTFTELLAEYQSTIDKPQATWSFLNTDELANPFATSQTNFASVKPQPVRWLWQKRLPFSDITLLDGDHGCGKSLLALQIAACVSSGTPMPDGSTTVQGGVVIVSPHSDAVPTQLQLLTSLGADLSHVQILSSIEESAPLSDTADSHPFAIPEDLIRLLQAIKQVNARLIIFDPFISLLSRQNRWTDQRLGHLLADLHHLLIQHHVACLITRNCHAKGGHARPTVLERSDHFVTVASSRLLLAPDPLQSDRLLFSHATSRHAALTSTLVLQIQPRPDNPDLPHITHLGSHSLQAKDLISYRPDTLHRQLLTQHLLQTITAATDPIPVVSLYALSPHSSAFQIQRSLSDLLHMGQIQRPIRGFYAPVPPFNTPATISQSTPPANHLNTCAAINQITQPPNHLNTPATISQSTQPANHLDASATISQSTQSLNHLNTSATISQSTPPANHLDASATISQSTQPTNHLNTPGAINQNTQSLNHLNTSATISQSTPPANHLDASAAISQNTQSLNHLDASATISQNTQPSNHLNTPATISQSTSPANHLNTPATISQSTPSANHLNTSAAISQSTPPANHLNTSAAISQRTQPANHLDASATISQRAQPPRSFKKSSATTTLKPKAPKHPHKGNHKQKNTKKRH